MKILDVLYARFGGSLPDWFMYVFAVVCWSPFLFVSLKYGSIGPHYPSNFGIPWYEDIAMWLFIGWFAFCVLIKIFFNKGPLK